MTLRDLGCTILGMPSFDYSTVGMTDLFGLGGVDLMAPMESSQMVVDGMGSGLQVADGSYLPTQLVSRDH
jgi:hypothetical protein